MTSITLVNPASAPSVMMCEAVVKTAIQKCARYRRFDVDLLPVHHAGQHAGHGDVQNGTDRQRSDHADRQIALRILGFLRRGRNRVKSDVGEENVGRPRSDSRRNREARTSASP